MRIAILIAALAWTFPASAQPPADEAASTSLQQSEPTSDQQREARLLFRQGVRRAQEERWAEALELFQRSRALAERPSTLFNIAICLHRIGRLRESLSVVDLFLAMSDPTRDAADRDAASTLRPELLASFASFRLRVTPEVAQVEIDGAPSLGSGPVRELLLDPGSHHVTVHATGYEVSRLAVSALAGEALEREVALRLLVEPTTTLAVTAPTPSPVGHTSPTPGDDREGAPIYSRWWFWTAVGVVVAGTVTGAILLSGSPDRESPVPGDDGVLVYTLTGP